MISFSPVLNRTIAFLFLLLVASDWCRGADSFVARLPKYASSSKLSTGMWVKVRVMNEGMYKITFDELRALGFKNPKNVRVYGYGGQLLPEKLTADYLDDLPEVCTYLGDGFLLFYGVGVLKQIESTGTDPFTFSINPYSDCGHYFLSEVPGERLSPTVDGDFAADADMSINTHYAFNIYMPQTTNIYKGGSAWYDDGVLQSGSTKISLPFNNMVPGNNGCVTCYVDVANRQRNETENDSFRITASGLSSDSFILGFPKSFGNVLQSGKAHSLDFNVWYSSPYVSHVGHIYYLSASALCYNKLQGGYLVFNNLRSGAGKVLEHVVAGADAETQVWNVTNPNRITKCVCSVSADSLRFKGVANPFCKYVAFNPKGAGFLKVGAYAPVVNQNLHAFNGADLVILSPAQFFAQAQRLADLHRRNDGISVALFTQEQIFNEFSSGTPDPTAIRSFLKMLYDRAQADAKRVAPRYLLLFGDGCFDNKGVLANSYNVPHNWVLCPQWGSGSSNYPADDYYGMLADNGDFFSMGSASCQVAVGRLPVVTAEQAGGVVSKIEDYMMNNQMGPWKTRAVIVADDDYDPNKKDNQTLSFYSRFLNNGEELSQLIYKVCPGIIQKKVYNDSYTLVSESSRPCYPEVEKLIVENAQNGSMLINYIGHSNSVNWAGEQIFTQNQVASLTNKKQGVWFSASCSFAEFDHYNTSCGESLVLAPNGGAIAVVASSRDSYISDNKDFNLKFDSAFFSQTPEMTIGDVMLAAKNRVNNIARLQYALLGDPALHILFPSGRVVTDSVSTDTARAFSKVVVKGHIEQDGVYDKSFNGKVYVNVFDKEQVRSTKGNYADKDGAPMVSKFKDYSSILFSGSTQASEGQFSISFMVPSNIVYSYGNARIAYYACDTGNGTEAVGNYSGLVVGGSLDTVVTDSVGPQVAAFINTPSFRNGDVVGAEPVFMAKLYDTGGINASEVGIGHNLTLSVNGGDPVSLNDYFSYSMESCSDGMVAYKLTGLPDGFYTLTFKAWDLHNNSTTKRLTFVLENGKGPHINEVCASPNPAQDETCIQVKHDRPFSTVDYVVSIFGADGRCVNTLTGADNSETGQFQIPWNLRDASGLRVRGGVYICRVDLKTKETTFVGCSCKIVVLP